MSLAPPRAIARGGYSGNERRALWTNDRQQKVAGRSQKPTDSFGNLQSGFGWTLPRLCAVALLSRALRRSRRAVLLFASRERPASNEVAQGVKSPATGVEDSTLYLVILLSSFFMFVWVFFFPGSAWIGSNMQRDEWLRYVYEQYFGFFAPSSVLLKYNQLGPNIELTHALPGAVWALLAPFQLNSEVRNVQGGFLHRTFGRLMLLCAGVLMCGYALIDANNLYADVVDFAGYGGHVADSLDEFNARSLAGALPPFNLGGVRFLAAWFVITGVMTFSTASQFQKPQHIREHRCWALRHIAAGLWVAMQRPLFAAVRVMQALLLGFETASLPEVQADAFYYSAYFVTALYVLTAEKVIWQDNSATAQEVVPETR